MGVDARTTDLENEVLAAELATLYDSLEIPVDDPSYKAVDSDTKKIKVAALLKATKDASMLAQGAADTAQNAADTAQTTADDNQTAMIANRGLVVYSARIYETSDNVTNSGGKTEHVNDKGDSNQFILQLNTNNNRYYLQTTADSISDFNNNYTVQITPNPVDLDEARMPTYKATSDIGSTVWLEIALNDSSSTDKLDPFSIEIKKW